MAKRPVTAGSEQDAEAWLPSDADLGIGEDTAPVQDDTAAKIAAAMSDPAIARAIEEHIKKQVAALSVAPGVPAGGDFLVAMQALGKQIADSINRSTAATVEQMPGHVKPIAVEEVEARATAFVEMEAMIRDAADSYWELVRGGDMADAERISPVYLLREDWFAPGAIGSEMYVAGSTVRWFGAPGTHMEPRNAMARKISEAMWRYLGNEGAPNAEDLAAFASGMNRPSTPGASTPAGMPQFLPTRARGMPGASVVTEAGVADIAPPHTIGTVVKVLKGGFGSEPRVIMGQDG